MRLFNDLLNFLLPDHLTHLGLNRLDRLQLQHFIIIFWALFTAGLQSHVGQADIGDIDQSQRVYNVPVPWDAVIAQSQFPEMTKRRPG